MTETTATDAPRHDWNEVFPEKVLSARQLNVGYENANEIWDVRTERGPYIVKIPRAVAGRPRHPFWYGLFKLFGRHVYVDIESLKPLADFIHARTPLRVPREVAAAHSGQNVLCVTHLDVLGALLLKLGYAPVSVTNMAWLKLLSDGSLMQIEETGGIEFERR